MLAMRAYMRDRHVEQRENSAVLKQVGMKRRRDRTDVPLHGDRQLRRSLCDPDTHANTPKTLTTCAAAAVFLSATAVPTVKVMPACSAARRRKSFPSERLL